MKRLSFFIALTTILLFSCQNIDKEVVLTYPNGNPQLIYYTQGKDMDKVLVKEENFYENGEMRYQKHFKDGKPVDVWKFYYENGDVFAEADYSKTNNSANWKFYKEDGSVLAQQSDSIIIYEINSDESPANIICGSNKYQQTQYQFYTNFKMRSLGNLNEGNRDGHWIMWFPNGNKQTECSYTNGVAQGEQTVYYENGNARYKGSFYNGKRIGEWQFFDENGTLLNKQNFD